MINDPRSGIDRQVDYLVNVLSDLQFKVHKLTERVEELEEYEEPVFSDRCGECDSPWDYSTGECPECDPEAPEQAQAQEPEADNEWCAVTGYNDCECDSCTPTEPEDTNGFADYFESVRRDLKDMVVGLKETGKPGITFQVQTGTCSVCGGYCGE